MGGAATSSRDDPYRDGDADEQQGFDAPALGGVVEPQQGLEHSDDDATCQGTGERDQRADQRRGEHAGEGRRAERFQTDELTLRAGEHDGRERSEESAERPHEGRDEFGVDTGEAGLVGVAGRSLHCLADAGPAEEQTDTGRDDGYGDEHDDFGAGDPNTGHGPFTAERERISGSELDAEIGECIAEEVGELGDADRGDEQDDSGRGEQAGDDGQLDEGGERDAGRKSGSQGEPVVPAVVAD